MNVFNWQKNFVSARDAIIKYVLLGLKKTKLILGDTAETREIFDYIQKVENMRFCESAVDAGRMAADYKFVLDHVPGQHLTSQMVIFIDFYTSY